MLPQDMEIQLQRSTVQNSGQDIRKLKSNNEDLDIDQESVLRQFVTPCAKTSNGESLL